MKGRRRSRDSLFRCPGSSPSGVLNESARQRHVGVNARRSPPRAVALTPAASGASSSRTLLGGVLHNGEWSEGRHEPIVSKDEWRAATRGFVPGRPRGKDILSGRVRCGLCGRRMAIDQNGAGRVMYRCRHRGEGCPQPARTNNGLARAAVLGLKLLGDDERLQAAIRRTLAAGGRTEPGRARRRRRTGPAGTLVALSDKRRNLLDLYYRDKISAELFTEEETRLVPPLRRLVWRPPRSKPMSGHGTN